MSFLAPRADHPSVVDTEVLIVGGGPVGLGLAELLSRQGIDSIVFETRTEASCRQSRAVTVQRDVLALYDRLGIADDIRRDGSVWELGRTYFGETEVCQLRWPARGDEIYPPFINFPQYRIEEMLYTTVSASEHAELRLGHRVTTLRQEADRVVLAAEADVPGIFTGRYIVGADGIGSLVRRQLGIPFDGRRTEGRFLVADFQADLPFARERRLWFRPPFHPDGIVLMHGIERDLWRLDWQIPVGLDTTAELEPAAVEARIHATLGDYEVTVRRANTYTFQQRQAARFRSGRAFLAGDAAHVVSPFGARGMNSGMEDAENLAWKLGHVLQGHADERLLDSYESERQSAAEHHVSVTGESMRFMTPDSAEGVQRRDATLRAAAQDPERAGEVDSGKLYEPFPYTDSVLTTASPDAPDETVAVVAGTLVPDGNCVVRPVRPTAPRTLRGALGGDLSVLLVTGTATTAASAARALADIPVPEHVCRVLVLPNRSLDDAPEGVATFTELSPGVAALLDAPGDTLMIVRPDCYVAAVIPIADHAEAAHHVERALAPLLAASESSHAAPTTKEAV